VIILTSIYLIASNNIGPSDLGGAVDSLCGDISEVKSSVDEVIHRTISVTDNVDNLTTTNVKLDKHVTEVADVISKGFQQWANKSNSPLNNWSMDVTPEKKIVVFVAFYKFK